jgi:hypothetical protein
VRSSSISAVAACRRPLNRAACAPGRRSSRVSETQTITHAGGRVITGWSADRASTTSRLVRCQLLRGSGALAGPPASCDSMVSGEIPCSLERSHALWTDATLSGQMPRSLERFHVLWRDPTPSGQMPRPLDRCHALWTDATLPGRLHVFGYSREWGVDCPLEEVCPFHVKRPSDLSPSLPREYGEDPVPCSPTALRLLNDQCTPRVR